MNKWSVNETALLNLTWLLKTEQRKDVKYYTTWNANLGATVPLKYKE